MIISVFYKFYQNSSAGAAEQSRYKNFTNFKNKMSESTTGKEMRTDKDLLHLQETAASFKIDITEEELQMIYFGLTGREVAETYERLISNIILSELRALAAEKSVVENETINEFHARYLSKCKPAFQEVQGVLLEVFKIDERISVGADMLPMQGQAARIAQLAEEAIPVYLKNKYKLLLLQENLKQLKLLNAAGAQTLKLAHVYKK